MSHQNPSRVAIVGGLRTPFVKAGGAYKNKSALALAQQLVSELVDRCSLKDDQLDLLVFGQVAPSLDTVNVARELVLGTRLSRSTEAFSVSRACATSTQALVSATQAILTGQAKIALAGGTDSLSRPLISLGPHLIDALVAANATKAPLAKVKPFLELRPKDLLPQAPGLTEPSTGLTMGQAAEKMAKENGVSRAEQDALALRSHQRATLAWEQGVYAEEVMPLWVANAGASNAGAGAFVERDGIIRPDASLARLSALRPVFDLRHGTVTAGNSSPLTDGAAAVLLMREDVARALGFRALAYVRAWTFAGVDPQWQVLMGPALAIPKVLAATGLSLADFSLYDFHEAFAAQVLSTVLALGSATWCEKHLGCGKVGDVDPEKLNIHGGSIALGHPFGATGARQALTVARELNRRGGGLGLVSQCAAGGLGSALILEAEGA